MLFSLFSLAGLFLLSNCCAIYALQKMPGQRVGLDALPEQSNFEKAYLLCKDLSANPCHEMLVGELFLPLSKHLKVKML